jgi:feruloyl esterase
MKTNFKPDANTQVLLAKRFKQGDALLLSGTPSATTFTAPVDLCLVKIVVGPGNAGPASAPSTSAGIGLEVWLPDATKWNERIRNYGNGGWSGSSETNVSQISTSADGIDLHVAAVGKGFVVGTSDNGHVGGSGAFAMNPDGSINTTLWRDFAERSLHELADKSKSLAKAYYGKAHKYAYWDGYSTGGRQALKAAQVYPEDYDGILAGAPAINWTKFITSELYPQIVMLRDLGAVLAPAKLTAVTNSAVSSCGGAALGFLIDPLACRYDPTRDAVALCAGSTGSGGIVGTNADAASCLNRAEAMAINKIWYGQTADGTVPDPAVDVGTGSSLSSTNHLWFGMTRGTNLGLLAGSSVFPIATDQVALNLQDSTYAGTSFLNAKANGTNRWTTLDYTGLATAMAEGIRLQSSFSNINTDNPDLSGFTRRNGKLMLYHGLADNLIAPEGSINYYTRTAAGMGGIVEIQEFFKFYLVPGLGHTGRVTAGPKVPVPQTALGRDEMFTALQKWVETGEGPGTITVSSADNSTSLPLCVYPAKITYSGAGAVTAAASYRCQ